MSDPELFEPFFRGPTWAAWRTFLVGFFGEPMSPDQFQIFQKHTGRTKPPTTAFREAVLRCGRRAGKSRILALIATFLATIAASDYVSRLAPSERAVIAVIAADRKQARIIFLFIQGLLTNIPLFAGLIEKETSDAIHLTNSVSIEIHTASFRVTRGYSLAAALCDEVAYWRSDDTAANPDEEILTALGPGLSNLQGKLLIASSPYGKRGALYKLDVENYGQDDSDILVWVGTTLDMNPNIDPRDRERAFKRDPAKASAEWDAQYRTDVQALLSREVIEAATAHGCYEIAPAPGVQYFGFVDPSGGSSDSMGLAISHREGDRAILDAVREFAPPFSPAAVVHSCSELLKSYHLTRVVGDRYAGEWPRERFRELGITYEVSEKTKSRIYGDLLAQMNSGRAQLLDLPVIQNQFLGLDRRSSRTGQDIIDHAPGSHDDVANAVAGSLLLAGATGGSYDATMEWVDGLAELAGF